MEGCGGQNQVLPTSGIKQKKVAEKTASRQERERGINTVGFKVQIANIKKSLKYATRKMGQEFGNQVAGDYNNFHYTYRMAPDG